MSEDFKRQVSRTLILLGKKTPFFAVLAMFTEIVPKKDLKMAATDGKDIYINPDRFQFLNDAQRQTVVCHELLHAALLHVPRCQDRDRRLWNIAADICVNGILAAEKFPLSEEYIRMPWLENETVEEIYSQLQDPDGLETPNNGGDPTGLLEDLLSARKEAAPELAQHWQQAMDTAYKTAGAMPGRMKREYNQREKATALSWRDLLWRFLAPAQHDYAGYDRRFVGRGLYLDALDGFSVQVALAIDTSGSIGKEELEVFQNEIQGILGAYPTIEITLYYADTELNGPYHLDRNTSTFPEPVGGGGTCFEPFFEEIEFEPFQVAIYLTDGYGSFPARAPDLPVLWVISPRGRTNVPFGQMVQL